jgi:hypothetical protein
MSFREKSAWLMVGVLALTGGYYAVQTAANWIALGEAPPPSLKIALVYLVFVVIGASVAMATLGAASPKEANAPADERERIALERASHWAGWIVSVFAIIGVLQYYAQRDGDLMFQIVMAGLMISQFAEYVFQIFLFRRGV